MNINTHYPSKQVNLTTCLLHQIDNFNQLKTQIQVQRSEKIHCKESFFPLQKLGSNQNYNSSAKQILLQKSSSLGFTPKRQFNQEISQYLSDRNANKKNLYDPSDKCPQKLQHSPHPLHEASIRPSNRVKLEEQANFKNHVNSNKFIAMDQNDAELKSEQFQQEDKEEDRMPKRGLTYISKKLSLLLRQKKRIKSSELFNISFFEDENDEIDEEKPLEASPTPNFLEKIHFKAQKQSQELKDTKQRRNVRRRIYDSINVMVALGIIKKVKNQFIYIQQKDDITNRYSIIQQEQILAKKKDFLSKLENDCLYKERCLKYLTEAYSKMKTLRKLNAQYEDKLNTLNENTFTSTQASSASPQQKIEFPFVLFQNSNRDMKVELINETEEAEQRIKKVNDWTDYIEVQNQNKQREIEMIKVSGQKLSMISDVDCINLLNCLEVDQHAEGFEKNQSEILRDYDIINQHKQKKSEEVGKGLGRSEKK